MMVIKFKISKKKRHAFLVYFFFSYYFFLPGGCFFKALILSHSRQYMYTSWTSCGCITRFTCWCCYFCSNSSSSSCCSCWRQGFVVVTKVICTTGRFKVRIVTNLRKDIETLNKTNTVLKGRKSRIWLNLVFRFACLQGISKSQSKFSIRSVFVKIRAGFPWTIIFTSFFQKKKTLYKD